MATYDLVVRGGTVIDGTRAPRFDADVGVTGGRIVALGDLSGRRARSEIDAHGRIVAPGFVDAHTHDDQSVLRDPALPFKLSQGVTTVVTGNCGISLAPMRPRQPGPLPAPLDLLEDALAQPFDRFGDYLRALDASPAAVNVAALVGHSTLRVNTMDALGRAATPQEVAAMRALLEEALDAGAIGMSTGTFYPPAAAASTEEIVAVGAPLAAHGALYVFYSIHLSDHHYSTFLVGCLWSLGVVAEIVVFFFMARLLRRFGLRTLLLVSFSAAVLRFLREAPGSEALGIAYAAAYLKAAPASSIDGEAFEALGAMAERLARRGSSSQAAKGGEATKAQAIAAQLEVAAAYGVNMVGFEREGQVRLCYDGEAHRRVLTLPATEAQKALAALALTRHDCLSPDMTPVERFARDNWRAELLDRIETDTLPAVMKNRIRLRKAGVWASLAYQRARRSELGASAVQQAGNRAIAELAGIDRNELTEADTSAYADAAIRVGVSRWAAEPSSQATKEELRKVSGMTDEAVLDAAERLFTASEPGSVSLRSVALEAGITYSLVNRHIGSREALYDALIARYEDRWRSRFASAQAS